MGCPGERSWSKLLSAAIPARTSGLVISNHVKLIPASRPSSKISSTNAKVNTKSSSYNSQHFVPEIQPPHGRRLPKALTKGYRNQYKPKPSKEPQTSLQAYGPYFSTSVHRERFSSRMVLHTTKHFDILRAVVIVTIDLTYHGALRYTTSIYSDYF